MLPAVENIFESFTHNPLTQAQSKPTLISLMGIHKYCIANASKFVSDFGRGRHVCMYVAMVEQQ